MTGRPCAALSAWNVPSQRLRFDARIRATSGPRGRRARAGFDWALPLRYRVYNTSSWYEGTIDNLSQTGLLFHGPQPLPVNALIEMVFEMPEEISGQKNRNVLCQGRVIRAKGSKADEAPGKEQAQEQGNGTEQQPSLLGASIVDYKFVR